MSECVRPHGWAQIGIYGIGTALHESTRLVMFNDKDAADTGRFENSLLFFFVKAMKTIGYNNLMN